MLLRLQNFYECQRRDIFFREPNTNEKAPQFYRPTEREVDFSCKNYKYKYLLELPYTYFDLKFFHSFVQGKEKKFNTLM